MNSKLLQINKSEKEDNLSRTTGETLSGHSQRPKDHELLAGFKIMIFLKGIRKIRQAIVSKLAQTLISSQVRAFLSTSILLAPCSDSITREVSRFSIF